MSRPLVVAGVLVAASAAAAAYVLRPPPPAAVQPIAPVAARVEPAPTPPPAVIVPPPAPVPALAPAPSPPAAAAPAPAPPSFDVVRVSPQGSAVIAGRAEPGADVVVFDGTREVARTRADRRGEFVALPPAPLAEGGRELTLSSRTGAAAPVRSDATVVVVVPPKPAPPPAPPPVETPVAANAPPPPPAAAPVTPPAPTVMAVLIPQAGPSRILEAPRTALSLDVIDYDEAGGIRFSGQAPSGSGVRIYVDNATVGDAQADAAGRWSLTPSAAVTPGVHAVRVDQIDATGRVLARVELPFQRAAVAAAEVATGRVVVQPGQNLWRLARSAYGSGIRYTVIYEANQEQIRNPRLIYPGQVFAIPVSGR